MTVQRQATCVAIGARALLLEGDSGTGKSSLALALIDRGATLIGDDGVLLRAERGLLFASPHPNTTGMLEVRNLGILPFPVCDEAPVCLHLRLSYEAPRFVEGPGREEVEGVSLPTFVLWPDSPFLALRSELALARFGLVPPDCAA